MREIDDLEGIAVLKKYRFLGQLYSLEMRQERRQFIRITPKRTPRSKSFRTIGAALIEPREQTYGQRVVSDIAIGTEVRCIAHAFVKCGEWVGSS